MANHDITPNQMHVRIILKLHITIQWKLCNECILSTQRIHTMYHLI